MWPLPSANSVSCKTAHAPRSCAVSTSCHGDRCRVARCSRGPARLEGESWAWKGHRDKVARRQAEKSGRQIAMTCESRTVRRTGLSGRAFEPPALAWRLRLEGQAACRRRARSKPRPPAAGSRKTDTPTVRGLPRRRSASNRCRLSCGKVQMDRRCRPMRSRSGRFRAP